MIAGDDSIRKLPVKKIVAVPMGFDFFKIRREPKGILNTSEPGWLQHSKHRETGH
jgi:hypothetical protein